MKKILLGLGALGAVLVSASMFAAFEAHVVNVTATIENALAVAASHIKFGTVFPQEYLKQPLAVQLSDSFVREGRVDDVEYFIRQKPKCGITSQNGTVLDEANTATGHILPNNQTTSTDDYIIDCGPAPRQLTIGEVWGVLPSLCEYISKDGSDEDGLVTQNDGTLASFHKPWTFSNGVVTWTDTLGKLTKIGQDTIDNWIIDLSVPCFGGFCGQDWAQFVADHDGDNDANAADYVQPIGNEHKVFGCDLWVEVAGVSETLPQCSDGIDNDQDGDTDHPDDLGCDDPSDNDENNE